MKLWKKFTTLKKRYNYNWVMINFIIAVSICLTHIYSNPEIKTRPQLIDTLYFEGDTFFLNSNDKIKLLNDSIVLYKKYNESEIIRRCITLFPNSFHVNIVDYSYSQDVETLFSGTISGNTIIPEGFAISYYISGPYKKIIEEKCFYKNGKIEGPLILYFHSGFLQMYQNFENGEPSGMYELYYDHLFQIKEKGKIYKGCQKGQEIQYYRNGKIKSVGIYTGKLAPDSLVYKEYENGDIEELGQRISDSNYNILADKNLNGTGQSIFCRRRLLKRGLWKYYYQSGEIKLKEWYNCKGDLIREKKFHPKSYNK